MALPEEPYTRIERYLARLSGQNVDIPEYPITRIECYLDYLCGNGGGVPAPNAGGHNAIFRGKSLGNSFTDAQADAIDSGTFEDIFVGDYWTVGNVTYRIVGLDMFWNIGESSPLRVHHAVIMPDRPMTTSQYFSANEYTGGYPASLIKTIALEGLITQVESIFGTLISFMNRVPASTSTTAWITSKLDIPTACQALGSWVGTLMLQSLSISEPVQFPAFALQPGLLWGSDWWLIDPVSDTTGSVIGTDGRTVRVPFSASRGVRPYFLIGKVPSP